MSACSRAGGRVGGGDCSFIWSVSTVSTVAVVVVVVIGTGVVSTSMGGARPLEEALSLCDERERVPY
eukprot:scaffold2384_cov76-Amphora_coffeaeformis.AAC.1